MEVERSYLRARAIATELGDHDALLRVLIGLRIFYRFRLELEKSRALGEEALASAQVHDAEWLGTAHFALADTLMHLGEFEQARQHYEQAQSSGKSVRAFRLTIHAEPIMLAQSASPLWILGFPAQALDLSRRALALVRQQGLAEQTSIVLMFLARVHQWLCDRPSVMKLAEESLALADVVAPPSFQPVRRRSGVGRWRTRDARVRDWSKCVRR